MLPNFLIIGAMRCATGWIRQCLLEHPDIFIPRYETHFFDIHYHNGLRWWEQRYFSGYGGEKAVGEKTATYLHVPEVPRRIANSLPGVKLICCLRDPTDRAYSHYLMMARNDKGIRATPFLQATTPDSDFVRRGLYFRQIKWFLELFPRESLLIKIYEDKEQDPTGFIQGIFEFLGVDSNFVPPSVQVQTKPGAIENVNKLWSIMSRMLLDPRTPLLSKKLYSKIRPKGSALDVDEDSLKTLARFFDEDIRELEKYLKRDLGCWKSKLLIDS